MGEDFILNFVVALGSATVVAVLFHAIRLPPIVGFITTGILIGPHGFGFIGTLPEVEILTEVGAVLLMFTIGLEFSLKQVLSLKRMLLGFGAAQVGITILVVAWLSQMLFSVPWSKGLFFGGLVALSSTAVVMKLLQDHRDTYTPYGRVSLSILIFQDLAVVPMILMLPILAGADQWSLTTVTFEEVGIFLLKGIALIGFIVLSARYVVPFLLERVVRTRSNEVFFFSILFICVGTAWFMEEMGLSVSLGAFFAGIMVSESPYAKQATGEFTPLRDNFLGLFFISMGMLVETSFIMSHFSAILGLALLLFAIKIAVIFTVIWSTGNVSSLAIVTSLILFQMGEFSFILSEQGMDVGLLTEVERQYFLSISILSIILTPLFYRLAPRIGFESEYKNVVPKGVQNLATQIRKSILRDPLKIKVHDISNLKDEDQTPHTIIIGYGIGGQVVSQTLKAIDMPYRIIELNAQTVSKFQKQNEPILFGDASNVEVLHQAQIEKARFIVMTIAGDMISRSVINSIRRLRPDIPIIIRVQYFQEIKTIGGSGPIEWVVGEFETTLEVVGRLLQTCGAEDQQVQKLVSLAREHLTKHGNS